MKKLAIATITAAVLALVMAGATLWRTRNASSSEQPGAQQIEVPDASNKTFLVAGQAVRRINLKLKLVKAPSATVAESMIISQNPAAGTKVPTGTEVELLVSSGPP
jgi:beta-lactam-binding protein with PASTA domain